MKKYKVVGLPKMHNGGIGAGHPHKLKKNRNKGGFTLSNSGPTGSLIAPDDPIKEKKLSRKQNKELGEMSYEEMVNYVNEQNNMFKELNLPAQYKMPDLSKVYGRKELQGLSREERKAYKNMPFYDQIKFRKEKIRSDDFYNVDDISTQEIVDPIPTTTDVKPNYYGDDHHNTQRSILESFNKIEKEYVLPKYEQREDGSYFKVRDEISRYDLEVEELRKKYETIEAQMRASFGDREGDPTHAEDWQNRDGKLYRKQLNALGSELQNLFLKRREQAGENVGVQQWSMVKINEETEIPRLNIPFKRTAQYNFQFNKENEKEMGYIPKNYLLDFNDVVMYPKVSDLQEALKNDKLTLDQRNRYEEMIKDNKSDKQQQLNKQAELLWTLGAIEGYIPDKQVPIGGTIEDLENFISDYETDIADFKKQKTASNAQLKDYAAYIGVKNFDPKEGNLASEANYKLLRKAMGKNPSDQYLMKIYKDIFMEGFDPNATQLTQEQMGTMIDAGWGDGSMDAIKDLAKVVAYGAPAAPFVVSGLVTLMNNPFFHLVMDGYFAYETPQMVEDFYKNAKNVMETTEAGTWDRLTGVGGMSLDAAFVAMGFSGGKRIITGANEARKTLTGAAKSEAELSKILREQLSAKGKMPTGEYKQRMKESNFRKEEELIQNASLKELQAKAAREKGIFRDEAGNTIIQTNSPTNLPIYVQYTRKGKPGVELTDASGNVISNTGKGDVIIGMGETEKVFNPAVGQVPVVKIPQTWITKKIKIGNSTFQFGFYEQDALIKFVTEGAMEAVAKSTRPLLEGNYEIVKASEFGLGEQYGNATVMVFNDAVKIRAEELEKLSKKVDVLIAGKDGQAIVLNQKALPQYTSKIKYKASELGFEKQRIEHGSPIGIQGELDPLFRQRADVDQTVLKPKEKGFTRSESTGSSSSGTGIYFSQPANMQKNLKRGMPNANPTGYALSPQGEGYIYESTIKPDAVIVRQDGMSKILNEAGFTWGTGIAKVPEEAYKILRDAGVDIVVGSFKKGSVNEYLVINPEAITELGQTAKTDVKKYQVAYADRGMQKLMDFDTKAEAVAFVEKMGGKQSKDPKFQDYYSNLKSGDNFQIKEIKIDKEEILGPMKQKVPKSFKSEIDWAKWNKDIPNNKPLIEEYRAIEHNTKQDGTWMKNPDGTPFDGTKEQFVQQQSENFKKAFPEGYNTMYRGSVINWANKERGFPTLTTRYTGPESEGTSVFMTSSEDIAKVYGDGQSRKFGEFVEGNPSEDLPAGGLYELAVPKTTQTENLNIYGQGNYWHSIPTTEGGVEVGIVQLDQAIAKQEERISVIEDNFWEAWIRQERLRTYQGGEDISTEEAKKLAENEIKKIKEVIKKEKDLKNKLIENKDKYATSEDLAKIEKELSDLRGWENDPGILTTDDFSEYLEATPDLKRINIDNIVDSAPQGDITINKHIKGNYAKSKVGNDGMFDMTNPDIYKSVLPLVGTAGAAAAAASDEDVDASMMAALPLMIFGKGKKINLKNVYKNIREFFKTVPALKNVPFKQSELQSSVLKNLPAKFKKEFGPDVTFEQLVKEQPEMLKNLIVEHIVNRYEYYESNIPGIPTKRRVTERELPIFYAEQDEAAQFALDFNTAWMEGSLDPRSKELIKPVVDGIRETRKLEEEIASFKPLYDDAIEEVRDGIQNDWNRKVMFPGSMGPMSDAVSKEEALKIGKDLLKVYKDAAAKVVGTDNHGNYDKLIKDLEQDITVISQNGIDAFRKTKLNESVYPYTELQAEEFINANSDIVYDYYDMQDRKDAAYDQIKDQIDAIGPVENVLAPDVAERVNALRGNVQDILDTSKAATLEARGTLNKKSVDSDIISALADARYSESDLKGTAGEALKGDYYSFAGVRDTTNKGNVAQITKRGLPANSNNLDELYTMYEKGFLRDKLKGLVVRQEDTLRQPIGIAGTVAHEDKHIYQAVIGYLDPHVESQIYGYQVADQKSDLGKAIQEVLIEPKKIDDPSATVDEGDIYSTETYMASPVEADANLQKERVKYAYKKFQEIMNSDNPVSKFRKLKESAGSDARYQKAVIEEIVKVMKIPENKAQFIEDLMSSPIGNAVNRHFKKKYRGAIDPLTDDTKTMAGKEMARQFLEMLPALLIGAGLMSEMSDAESPEELMTAGILGFATRGKIKGLSKFRGVTKTPLTFKSFMPNGKIMNLAKDKMGRIPTEQALAILAKEGSGSYKSEVLAEALKTKFNGKVPSKIDPEILKNLAEETIIPLNLEVVDKKTTVGVNPEYGFDHIGYRDPKQQEIIGRSLTSNAIEAASEEARITTQQSINDRAEQIKKLEEEMDNLEDALKNFDDYEDKGYFPTGTRPSEFKKELEEVTKRYDELIADKPPHNLENNTILFNSDALPGLGSDDHSSGVNNLAHVHYTVRSDSPDTFTVTQFQSDFFQDREKRLPRYLDATDETLDKHINYQEKQYQANKSLQDNAVDLGNGKSRLADGTVVWNEYFQNSPPDRSMIEKYTTIKKNREPIKILQKTWEARTLQETVDYAARNGQTKFRFPTGETASKLQNYGDDVAEAIKTGSKEKLVKTGDEEKLQITKRYEKTYPKLIEKIYGVKLRKVSDAQGNSWWEFDIPKDMIEGTRDIIAYKEGGQIKRKLKRPNPQFEELELTEEEALAYAQKGYIVEAIS